MNSLNEELFAWKKHISLLNKLLLKWRYIRDMSLNRIPIYLGATSKETSPEEMKKIAIVQVDLLQSALHNIEHGIIGLLCNCKRVKVKNIG